MTESSFSNRKNELIEEFEDLDDPQDRLIYLVDRGKSHPTLPEELKVDKYRVPGCLSRVWVCPSVEKGACKFRIDSDAQIPKGIAAILAELASGLTPSEIRDADFSFLNELGLTEHLTPNRRNALSRIVSIVLSYAEICQCCDGVGCEDTTCPVENDEDFTVQIGGRITRTKGPTIADDVAPQAASTEHRPRT